MSYNFKVDDLSEFMSSENYSDDLDILFPKNTASIHVKKEIINNDIFLFKTTAQANESISFESTGEVNGLVLNIVLEGCLKYQDNEINKNEQYSKNETYVKYVNNQSSKTILPRNSNSRGVGIIIKDDFLEKYLFNTENNIKKDSLYTGVHTSKYNFSNKKNILKLANEIFTSPFTNDLNEIYIQSKVFEIIYNEFSNLNEKQKIKKKQVIKLSQEDIYALHKANDIIQNSDTYPSLSVLAKMVAINEFKLKYGFKKIFNDSPGNLILKQKMMKAKELLESSEFSISEISNFVGYKYQQSFTNAFTKYFSLKPMDLIKKRKYYF